MPKISEVHRGGRETLEMPGLPWLQEVLRGGAHLGRECGEIAQRCLDSLPTNIREGSLGRLRNLIREKLRPQLDEIDGIVPDTEVTGWHLAAKEPQVAAPGIILTG